MATIQAFSADLVALLKAHVALAYPLIFALAFGKSLAIVSVVLPFVSALVVLGAAVGPAGGDTVIAWVAGTAGACFGYWLSYIFGFAYGDRIRAVLAAERTQTLLDQGLALFEKWGALAVFIGRFFAPLRATVAMVRMRGWTFQLMNVASGALWVAGLLLPGVLAQWLPLPSWLQMFSHE
jgi:membrane protein DedA with SNARE-associated domain